MPTPGRPLVGILALLFSLTFARAATPAAAPAPPAVPAGPEAATPPAAAAKPKTEAEFFASQGVKLTAGPAAVPLGTVAELKLPAGYHFVGPDSLDKFYELTHNMRSGKEVGVVIAPNEWKLFLSYDAVGFVKDDEKDKLNADKLMASMKENEAAGNEERKKRGWDEMKIQSWATPPHYDDKSNNLRWAFNLSSSDDGYKDVWINESIRLLGRGGVMKVILVTSPTSFKSDEAEADKLLTGNFGYVAGQKYSEFRSGDKIAEYGLGALVLGGAGVIAAKAGLFAKLGVFLASAWKLVVVAIVALGGFFKKMWKKITGRA